jgi:transcriptional regulator with XRE-family HTH domain
MRVLKIMRAEKGWTQGDAARVVGVDVNTYSQLERGFRKPHATTLAKLAKGFGVSVSELVEEVRV